MVNPSNSSNVTALGVTAWLVAAWPNACVDVPIRPTSRRKNFIFTILSELPLIDHERADGADCRSRPVASFSESLPSSLLVNLPFGSYSQNWRPSKTKHLAVSWGVASIGRGGSSLAFSSLSIAIGRQR